MNPSATWAVCHHGKQTQQDEQAFLAQAKLLWAGELNRAAWRTGTLLIAQDNFDSVSNLKLQMLGFLQCMVKSNSGVFYKWACKNGLWYFRYQKNQL